MKRGAAVEPVIGHIRNKLRVDRNYFAGSQGYAVIAIPAAAGYNFRLLLTWLGLLLRVFVPALSEPVRTQSA